MINSGEEPSTLGGRFSKSSSERERILQRRKEHMLLAARRKYVERHRDQVTDSPSRSPRDVEEAMS